MSAVAGDVAPKERAAASRPQPERVAAAVRRLCDYVNFKRPSVPRVDALVLLEVVGNT